MKYEKIISAQFLERPNRFIAKVIVDGRTTTVHVKNTGRCKELLIPGVNVWLEDYEGRMGLRKMRYSLIGVEKQTRAGIIKINMDSQAPNKVVAEALADGRISLPGMDRLTLIKGEKTYGDSRLDFYVEDCKGAKGFAEVKGVTLENEGVCSFPDAPTERGVKHINELVAALEEGYRAYIIFVIQMEGMKLFTPNDITHKAFGDALREAAAAGVGILAYQCKVTEVSIEVTKPIEIFLG